MLEKIRNASDVLVECLEKEGIKYIFGVPGEENLTFLESVRTSNISFITTRNEQAAVFMAATFGRLTGKTGVALSTLGPGATNLVTGVAYATLGGFPLLVITGQKPIKKSKQGRFQIIDVVSMMKPVTKSSETIVSTSRIPSIVNLAIKTAESEKPGAVHLELPEDIAEEPCDQKPIDSNHIFEPIASEKIIEEVAIEIERAKHPVIIVASGGNRKFIRKEFHEFLEKTQIPFVSTQTGKGVEDETSPLYIGTTSLSDGDYVHKALKKADLVIVIGHDTSEKPPIVLTSTDSKIIHINFSRATTDVVYTPTHEIVGDISHTLSSLSKTVHVNPNWDFAYFFEMRDMLKKDIEAFSDSLDFPLRPEKIVNDIQNTLPQNGMLALDNGMYKIWISRNFVSKEQNSLLLDNALATMGAGLSSGIASKILFPEKKVLVVSGDGGIMMNIAELETAVRLKLDLTILVLNDSGFGMINWKQKNMNLPSFSLSFSNPDFVMLANSFGAIGHEVTDTKELKEILHNSFNSKGVHLINCPINYEQANELLDNLVKENLLKK